MLRRAPRAGLAVVLLLASLPAGLAHGEGDANRRGVELFSAGRLEEAAEQFREALSENPDSEEVQRNLGHAIAALGQRKLLRGDIGSALEHLEEAIERLPDVPDFHVLLGLAHFRKGDLYSARRAAEDALSAREDHPQALELLGDIYYQEGYLSRAIPEWEAALENAGPRGPDLKRKIARAQKEYDAEGGFGRDISTHFTLQYDGPVSGETVRAVLKHLEDAYDEIGGELGAYPPADIPVILYSKILFRDITQSPMWVAGTFDGKIRVPVGGLSSAADVARLRPVLTHELAHAFIRSIAPGGLPLWFEEGLAKHFEGWDTGRAEQALHTLSEEVDPTFDGLRRGLRSRGRSVEASYLASLLAVRLLIESEGFWTVRRIVEAVGEGQTFEQAFREEVRLEVSEFESRWQESLP